MFGALEDFLLGLLLRVHQPIQEKQVINLLNLNRVDLFKEEVVIIVEVTNLCLGTNVINILLENSLVIG